MQYSAFWEAIATGGAPGVSTATQTLSITGGKTYRVTFTLLRLIGSVTPTLGSTVGTARSTDGTFTEEIVATDDGDLIFTTSDGSDLVIDDVIVKEVFDGMNKFYADTTFYQIVDIKGLLKVVNIIATETITAEQLTSTDDITAVGLIKGADLECTNNLIIGDDWTWLGASSIANFSDGNKKFIIKDNQDNSIIFEDDSVGMGVWLEFDTRTGSPKIRYGGAISNPLHQFTGNVEMSNNLDVNNIISGSDKGTNLTDVAITNPNFTGSASGWALGGGMGYFSNKIFAFQSSSAYQLITIKANTLYQVEFNTQTHFLGTVAIVLGGTTGTSFGSAGNHIQIINTTDTTGINITTSSGADVEIDTISVREVTGLFGDVVVFQENILVDNVFYRSPFDLSTRQENIDFFKGLTYEKDTENINEVGWAKIEHNSYRDVASSFYKDNTNQEGVISMVKMQQRLTSGTADLFNWNEEQDIIIADLTARIEALEEQPEL